MSKEQRTKNQDSRQIQPGLLFLVELSVFGIILYSLLFIPCSTLIDLFIEIPYCFCRFISQIH